MQDVEYTGEQLKGEDRIGRPYRVLVVDDEDATRNLLVRILKSAYYEVCGEASNGKFAVELYKTMMPDLVTLDVQMPIMDGYEALKEILRIDPKACVLMLTHEASLQTVLDILDANAKDYLLKPIERYKVLCKLKTIRRDTAR